MTGTAKLDIQTASADECRAESEKWLNTAVRAETTERPASMVDKGLDVAHKWEKAANDGRA